MLLNARKNPKAIDKLKIFFRRSMARNSLKRVVFLNLKNNELIERAKKLKDGVPFATPVFDGAKELDINNFLHLHQVIQVVKKL